MNSLHFTGQVMNELMDSLLYSHQVLHVMKLGPLQYLQDLFPQLLLAHHPVTNPYLVLLVDVLSLHEVYHEHQLLYLLQTQAALQPSLKPLFNQQDIPLGGLDQFVFDGLHIPAFLQLGQLFDLLIELYSILLCKKSLIDILYIFKGNLFLLLYLVQQSQLLFYHVSRLHLLNNYKHSAFPQNLYATSQLLYSSQAFVYYVVIFVEQLKEDEYGVDAVGQNTLYCCVNLSYLSIQGLGSVQEYVASQLKLEGEYFEVRNGVEIDRLYVKLIEYLYLPFDLILITGNFVPAAPQHQDKIL